MHRQLLGWLALGFSGLAAVVMAVTGAALGTGAGREVLVASALRYANSQLRGSLTVDSLAGSLWGGLEARGIRLVGEDGGQAISLDSLRFRYRIRDFLSRRIVLGQLALYGPSVTLEERRDGRLNLQHILKAGEGEGSGGPPPLIAFQDVDIDGGFVRIRTRGSPAGGQIDERTIELPSARFSYLQLASPFAGESGLVADVVRLNMKISDPALDVHAARGEIRLIGDSIVFDLDRVELANSQSSLRGTIYHLSDGPWFDLTFDADLIIPADIRAFVPSLPAEASGRGRFRPS